MSKLRFIFMVFSILWFASVFSISAVTAGRTSIASIDATDQFPFTTDSEGDYAIVGAEWQDDYKGAAYIRTRDGDGWSAPQILSPPDLGPLDHFGSSVSLSGDYAAVATTWQNLFTGAVYIFKRTDDEWAFHQKLTPAEGRPDYHFGQTVRIDGSDLIIGAGAVADDNVGVALVFHFTLIDDRWVPQPGVYIPESDEAEDRVKDVGLTPAADDGLDGYINQPADIYFPSDDPAERAFDSLRVRATDGFFEDRVQINWSNTGLDAIIYKISRNDTLISIASSDDTLYVDKAGVPGEVYEYCILVIDMAEDTLFGGCDPGSRIIFPPTTVAASDGTFDDFVRVTWNDMSFVEAGYYVLRDGSIFDSTAAGMSRYEDTTTEALSVHAYEVMAFDAFGNVSEGAADSGFLGIIMPPLNVLASDGEYPDRVVVTWIDQADDDAGYSIYRNDILYDSTDADDTSYTCTDMAPDVGVEYTYCVATRDALGGESVRVCDAGGIGILPAPGNVKASDSLYDNRIEITWSDRSDLEDSFIVIRDGSRLATVRANVTSYTDYDAAPGIGHQYCVMAVSDEGGMSTGVCDSGFRMVILAPFDVLATDGDFEDRVHITWNSVSTATVLFKVFRGDIFIKSVSSGTHSYIDYGGVAGEEYEYRVIAFTALDVASEEDADVGSRELLAPTDVAATGDDEYEDRVIITWTDNSETEQGYIIRRTADAVEEIVEEIGPDRVSLTDFTGAPGVTYVYSVAAFDSLAAGRGESEADDHEGGRKLLAPTGVTATDNVFENRVDITWLDNSYAEDGYRIYRDDVLCGSTEDNFTTFTDENPPFNQGIEYRVVAYDDYGESEGAFAVGSTTLLPPLSVNASESYSDRVEITWLDQSNIETGYEILRDGVPLGSVGEDITSFSDIPSGGGMSHEYCVRSLNISGEADFTGFVNLLPTRSVAVAIDGSYAYVADNGLDNLHGGLVKVDISQPDNPVQVAKYEMTTRAVDVVIRGEYAYVANRGRGLIIVNTESMDSVGSYNTPGDAYAVALSGNYAYVADYASGLLVIDISDPAHPSLAGTFPTGTDVCVSMYGDYAIVGDNSLQNIYVVDISDPTNPVQVGACSIPSIPRDIAVAGDYAYVAVDSAGLMVIDLSDPANPDSVAICDTIGQAYSVAIFNDYAYVAARESGLLVIDISDPVHPVLTSSHDTPNSVSGVAVSGDYAYIADWGGLQVVKIGNSSQLGCDEGRVYEQPTDFYTTTLFKKIVANDAVSSQGFGASVAIDGDVALIGAPYDDEGADDAGAAYIFERSSDGSWFQSQKLVPLSLEEHDGFGWSVAIDGDVAVITGRAYSRIAYIYERGSDGTWSQVAELHDTSWDSNFGHYLAIDRDMVIIAPFLNDRSAMIVERGSDGTWSQSGELDLYIGYDDNIASVQISNNIVFIGVTDDDDGGENAGAVYVFDRGSDGTWSQSQKILAENPSENAHFGSSFAIDGDEAIIAAANEESVYPSAGAVYIFERGLEGTWYQKQKIPSPLYPISPVYFGSAVAINGDMAVIGASGSGEGGTAFTLIRGRDGTWFLSQKLLPSSTFSNNFFGGELAMSDGIVIIPSVRDDDTLGSAAYILSTRVNASDGTLNSRVLVTWEDFSENESGYFIYRDDVLIYRSGPDEEAYEDYEAMPGRTYEYRVAAMAGAVNLGSYSDYGWRPPDGNITGRVTTSGGAGVDSVSIDLTPQPLRSLLLDGLGGRIRVTDNDEILDFDNSTSYTVEGWFKFTGAGGDGHYDAWIFAKGDSSGRCPIRLTNNRGSAFDSAGTFEFNISDGAQTISVATSGNNLNDGNWHHIACVHDAAQQEIRIYQDGELQDDSGYTNLGNIANTDPLKLGGNFSEGTGFGGQIDEIRIWSVARSDSLIQATMMQRLNGDEAGLVAYWPLDDGGSEVMTNYAGDMLYGKFLGGVYWVDDAPPMGVVTDINGNYAVNGIRYGTNTTFDIRPRLGNRQFSPAFKSITLGPGNPVENEIDFVDISTYTISGTVRYADTGCAVPDVQIMVDDEMQGVTDKNGIYAVSAGQGTHTIEAVFEDHVFSGDTTLTIDGDVSGIDFVDESTVFLTGRVGGGCGRYAGDVRIIIRSEDGCLCDTLLVSDSAYVDTLPPMTYLVRGEVVDSTIPDGLVRTDVKNFFTGLGERAVEFAAPDDILALDFVYRAPLQVTITGFPEPECEQLTYGDRTLPADLPVVPQRTVLPLIIEVNEYYGDSSGVPVLCPLDSGIVEIYDEILCREDSLITLEVINGEALYTTYTAGPSLVVGRLDTEGNDRSFQKMIRATAKVEGRAPVSTEQWVLITGHVAPVGSDFVTFTTTEIPFYILRDPPGDYSYAYLENYSMRTGVEYGETITGNSNGVSTHVRFGLDTDWIIGAFIAGTSYKVKLQGGLDFQNLNTDLVHHEWGTDVTLTMEDRYSTSADELFVGEAGDVFIGGGFNFIFADVGVVDVNNDLCAVTRTNDLGFQPDSTYTLFAYTQQYIQDVLIEDLRSKVQYYENPADSTVPYTENPDNPDSGAIFQWELDNWQRMLDFNDSLKAVASIEDTNRSFSSGADYSYFFKTDTTRSYKMYTTCIVDNIWDVVLLDSKFEGMEFGISLPITLHTEEVEDYVDTTETVSQGVGYVLSDNNIGDHFMMDITYDGIFPTPIFDVLAGVSSCPYEPWPDTAGVPRMIPRDSAILFNNTPPSELEGVPPDEPAVMNLTIANLSPTQDTRIYELREVSTTNPGGATISANGVWLYEGLIYYIDGDTSNNTQQVTLTVERGPTQYDYDSLAVMIYPQCEWDIWERRTGGPLMHSDTLWFNVSFEAPCSDITLDAPESGWIYDEANHGAGDSLEILLNGYQLEIGGKTVTGVGVDYRRLGTGNEGPGPWLPVTTLTPDSIETIIDWPLPADLADGVYELRAYTYCDDGGQVYSSVSTGTIDRHAPLVFGAPEPADSQLSLGENIGLTFNEPIDCRSVTGDNVSLRYLTGPDADSTIPIEAVCDGGSIVLLPVDSVSRADLEGQTLEARVSGITDLAGNIMAAPAVWSFTFRQSAFTWSQMTLSRDVAYRAPGEISAVLANGSSLAADFDIDVDSLPDWITSVSPQNGILAPHDTVRVSFTIREDIEMGIRETRVTATSEAVQNDAVLDIYLVISCHEPTWSFNPENYEHSMTLVAEVYVDGGMTEDAQDRVAAYVGGQLRGVANVEPGMIGSSVIYMTVYGNRVSGETVRFQVWDASECRLYTSTLERYPFVSEGWTGTPHEPVTLTATDELPETVQVIPLSQGWNWFSTYVNDGVMSPNDVLSDLTPQAGDILKSQTEFAEFDPDMGWVGSLSLLDNRSGYMIRLSEAGTILQEGSVVDPDTAWIPVSDGWNWVSYLPTGPIDVATALQSLNSILADGDIARSQDLFAQYAIAGETAEWFGNLDMMEPGEGYKLYLADGGDMVPGLVYPPFTEGGAAPQASVPDHYAGTEAPMAEEVPGWSIDQSAYRYNMTVVGALHIEGQECRRDDILVGAFADGECRGLSRPIYLPATDRYALFLMVHSNVVAGEAIDFQLLVPDERAVYDVSEVMAYEADEAAGTVREPLALRTMGVAYELPEAVPMVYSLSQNYPNPFNPNTTIEYALSEPGDVKLTIYNILGETVRVLVDKHQDAGYYSIVWDGKSKSGRGVATGIYFYHIEAGDFVKSKKMLLLK